MAKAKVKINKNTQFEDGDTDIEQDIKTLGQIRDMLFQELQEAQTSNDRVMISSQITSVVNARQQSEILFLRLAGIFDKENDDEDDYCEGCPECDPVMQKGNDEAN